MKIIANQDEFDKIISENKIVIVDFYADWCGPCKRLTPLLELFSESYPNVKFVKIDVDNKECDNLCKECKISCMPTILFYYNAKNREEYKVEGSSIQKINDSLNKLLKENITSNENI